MVGVSHIVHSDGVRVVCWKFDFGKPQYWTSGQKVIGVWHLHFLVAPASVKLSDLIDNTYHAQIEMTLEEAKGTQKILESKSGEGTETQPSGSEADQDGQRAGQNPGHTAGTSENSGTGVTGLLEKAKGAFGSAKETVTGAAGVFLVD